MPYKIGKDEKISDIVDKFDVPYDLIRRYNIFVESPEAIYEGRMISMPRSYTVLPGDTYESIGKTFSIIPAYLNELNPYIHSPNVIYPGQTIFLPPV